MESFWRLLKTIIIIFANKISFDVGHCFVQVLKDLENFLFFKIKVLYELSLLSVMFYHFKQMYNSSHLSKTLTNFHLFTHL